MCRKEPRRSKNEQRKKKLGDNRRNKKNIALKR